MTQAEREAEKKLIETVKQQDSSRGWAVKAFEEGIAFQEAIEAVRRAQNEVLRQTAEEPGKAALHEAIRSIQRATSAAPTDIDQGSKGNQSKG